MKRAFEAVLLTVVTSIGALPFGQASRAGPAAAPPTKRDDVPDAARGADGLEAALRNFRVTMAASPPRSPAEALAGLKVRDGLTVDLLAHEPTIKQPLYLSFDERGRLWVVQYRQYPFPAGLKVVAYDQHLRARFDKVPPPPPHHFRGVDRVSILEDIKGDGFFSKVTTFLDGLNVATAALPGRGGVWVLNPPYLLFYPDKDRTDKPGTPVVHLSGFGLEDTHAVASSLCWGPDGWLYGATGSTVTAKIRVEIDKATKTTDFLGQSIWRYHPQTHRFEVFAEGGGNTFGVAFDDAGRLYSGTNWPVYRGLHFVQGGYYLKAWGKHGPLTNPYALGYFDHMPHQGNADRLTHAFAVYGGGAIPELRGKLVGVNSLQNRVQVTRLHRHHSTWRTVEEPFLLTTDDPRFRPVDVKTGPDGALYVADFYEPRISHGDPRDTWDRATGRVYRIRPREYKPAPKQDLGSLSSEKLLGLLKHENRWYRETALRLLGERPQSPAVREQLERNLRTEEGQLALESLWALHRGNGLTDEVALAALSHGNPHVRRWAVRLLGDHGGASRAVLPKIIELAASDPDPEVRSQLASTAKRVSQLEDSLRIQTALWKHDEDIDDPHIPLLCWWALESKAGESPAAIVRVFADRTPWSGAIVEQVLLGRLMQRWVMGGGERELEACASLLDLAPDEKASARLLSGLEKGLAGRASAKLSPRLRQAIVRAWKAAPESARLTLGLRIGHPPAITAALDLVAREDADRALRMACLAVLAEVDEPRAVPVLLDVLRKSSRPKVRREALAALQRSREERIGQAVLDLYPAKLPEADGVRAAAHQLLVARPAWAKQFLLRIDAGKIDSRSLPQEVVRKLALHQDAEVARLVRKVYGTVRGGTRQEKVREMLRVGKLVKSGKGDASAGKTVYANTCAKCHKLFGIGGDVGPELTGYERGNVMYWVENIVDPSATIREEYMTFVVQTADGRTLSGVVAGQDKTTVTLKDQEGRVTKLDRARIDDMRASPVSLMPEDQLKALSDQQVRDLFAYLAGDGRVQTRPAQGR